MVQSSCESWADGSHLSGGENGVCVEWGLFGSGVLGGRGGAEMLSICVQASFEERPSL